MEQAPSENLDCGMMNDDTLNLQIQPVKLLVSKNFFNFIQCGAFAAILGDGSVVTWGHSDFGGDSSVAQQS